MGCGKSSVHRRREDPNTHYQSTKDIIPKNHDKMEYEDIEKKREMFAVVRDLVAEHKKEAKKTGHGDSRLSGSHFICCCCCIASAGP